MKSMVTLEDRIDIERKGVQSTQGVLYVRFACFCNGTLSMTVPMASIAASY